MSLQIICIVKILHIFNVFKVERNGNYKHQIQNNGYLCVSRMRQEVDMIKKKYIGTSTILAKLIS